MTLINVYSRAPIGYKFDVVIGGKEVFQIIEGTNSIGILTLQERLSGLKSDIYKTNSIDSTIFEAIKAKYKDHIPLFGGINEKGVKVEPLIFEAKTASEAKKMVENSSPVFKAQDIVSKNPNITVEATA